MERYKNIYFINLFPKRGKNYYKIMSCKFLFLLFHIGHHRECL